MSPGRRQKLRAQERREMFSTFGSIVKQNPTNPVHINIEVHKSPNPMQYTGSTIVQSPLRKNHSQVVQSSPSLEGTSTSSTKKENIFAPSLSRRLREHKSKRKAERKQQRLLKEKEKLKPKAVLISSGTQASLTVDEGVQATPWRDMGTQVSGDEIDNNYNRQQEIDNILNTLGNVSEQSVVEKKKVKGGKSLWGLAAKRVDDILKLSPRAENNAKKEGQRLADLAILEMKKSLGIDFLKGTNTDKDEDADVTTDTTGAGPEVTNERDSTAVATESTRLEKADDETTTSAAEKQKIANSVISSMLKKQEEDEGMQQSSNETTTAMSHVGENGKAKREFFVIVHNVAKKTNIGNMMRSASAFGASEIFVVGKKKDVNYFGSFGAEKHLKFTFFKSGLASLKEHCEKNNISICGVEIVPAAKDIRSHPFVGHPRTAFFLGNEGHGLNEKEKDICDFFTYIPQVGGGAASLNVTVAASICFHHFAYWADFPERKRTGEKFVRDTVKRKMGFDPNCPEDVRKRKERQEKKRRRQLEAMQADASTEPSNKKQFEKEN
eukprot:g4137.t1